MMYPGSAQGKERVHPSCQDGRRRYVCRGLEGWVRFQQMGGLEGFLGRRNRSGALEQSEHHRE
jgi:hypothetical protein